MFQQLISITNSLKQYDSSLRRSTIKHIKLVVLQQNQLNLKCRNKNIAI